MRAAAYVQTALVARAVTDGVLLNDGYAPHAEYCTKVDVTHAQCWVHKQHMFYKARHARPTEADHALKLTRALHANDEDLRTKRQIGGVNRTQLPLRSRPIIDSQLDWVDARLADQGLLPTDLLTRVLVYAKTRRVGFSVVLTEPDVPLDTNHVERALRPRSSWAARTGCSAGPVKGATHVDVI